MTGKRVIAGAMFFVGALIGGSTRTHVWDDFPLWVSFFILFIAIGICGSAMALWSAENPDE